MTGPITWDVMQWAMGLAMPAAVALIGWVAAELRSLRQMREADRKAQDERRVQEGAQRTHDQASHENDLRDLWQAFDLHRRESELQGRQAGQFRETVIAAIGDIKADLAVMKTQRPQPAGATP